MSDLINKVLAKCEQLGPAEAARYFDVTPQSIYNWMKGKGNPSVTHVEKVLAEEEKAAPYQATMWEGRKLHVLLPVYRSFSAETHLTLFACYAKYGAEKIGLHVETGTLIHESRNLLVDRFLKTDGEWCLFIDDDMVMPFGNDKAFNARYKANLPPHLAGVNAISRIMSHGTDKGIVGGLYFGRHSRGKAQCSEGFASDVANAALHDTSKMGELRKVSWTATGFMRIHRSVFDKIKAAAEEKWPHLIPSKPDRPFGYFTPDKVGQGEDVAFCLRAGQVGVNCFVDTGVVCLHTGQMHYGPSNTF